MATWRQLKAGPVKLFDEQCWTVVDDAPNQLRCLIRHQKAEDADRCLDNVLARNPHAYLLPPSRRRVAR